MKKILIINGHQPYPGISEGRLNGTMVDVASEVLKAAGHEVKVTLVTDEYDVQEEIKKHIWADVVILQSPVNWMMVSWRFKKYMDEVYSSGLQGDLCNNDGRHRVNPKAGYGSGGVLQGHKYMLSLTCNAPSEAFNDPNEYLFQGKSIDDLFFPMHMNFRFFAMEGLPTFSCHDVIKDNHTTDDIERYKEHLSKYVV